MVGARADSFCLAIGQTDVGRCVAGDGDVPFQVLQVFLPVALDGAVGRVVADVRPFAILNVEGGLQHDVLVSLRKTAGNGGCLTDAAQVLIAPRQEVAQQHHVITAIHRRVGLVAVPQFPDGGRAVLRHIAPRGIRLGGCQAVSHISKTIVAQSSQEPRDANDAT